MDLNFVYGMIASRVLIVVIMNRYIISYILKVALITCLNLDLITLHVF